MRPVPTPLLHLRHGLLALCLSAGSAAWASPASEDPLKDWLQSQGLVSRALEAGQQAGQAASGLVVTAMGYLGVPYRLGGNTFESGLDCSGFVRAIYEQTVGLVLPRRAAEQAQATREIAKEELQPGDLVFFNTLRRAYSHVGIYVGDNKFIHSPRPGAHVRVEDMGVNYWRTRFDGARRVDALDHPVPPQL